MKKKYQDFNELYPFYLTQHQNKTCKRLHFLATFLVISLVITTALTQRLQLLILIPFIGPGLAWTGHLFFEKNRPATFQYFRYSLAADFYMFYEVLIRKIQL